MTLQYLYRRVPFIFRQGKSFTYDLPHKIKNQVSLTKKVNIATNRPFVSVSFVRCSPRSGLAFGSFGGPDLAFRIYSSRDRKPEHLILGISNGPGRHGTQFAGPATKVGTLSSILRGELLGFLFWQHTRISWFGYMWKFVGDFFRETI